MEVGVGVGKNVPTPAPNAQPCVNIYEMNLEKYALTKYRHLNEHILWFEGVFCLDMNLYRTEQAVGPVSIPSRSSSFFLVEVCEQSTRCPTLRFSFCWGTHNFY
jgi:hypothetical protein